MVDEQHLPVGWECRVPPLLVTAIAAALMWWVADLVPGFSVNLKPRLLLGAAPFLVGAVLTLWAVWNLHQEGTTLDPHRPQRASTLLVGGAFQLCRHPIYTGMGLMLAGWSLYLADPAAWLVLPLWFAWIHKYQVLPEESVLLQRFGVSYESYSHRVGRWI